MEKKLTSGNADDSKKEKKKIDWVTYIQTWLPLVVVLISSTVQFTFINKTFQHEKEKTALQFKYETVKQVTDLYGELAYYAAMLHKKVHDYYVLTFSRLDAEKSYMLNIKDPGAKFEYESYFNLWNLNNNSKEEIMAHLERILRKIDLIAEISPAKSYDEVLNFSFPMLDTIMFTKSFILMEDEKKHIIMDEFNVQYKKQYSKAIGELIISYGETLKKKGYLSEDYDLHFDEKDLEKK